MSPPPSPPAYRNGVWFDQFHSGNCILWLYAGKCLFWNPVLPDSADDCPKPLLCFSPEIATEQDVHPSSSSLQAHAIVSSAMPPLQMMIQADDWARLPDWPPPFASFMRNL